MANSEVIYQSCRDAGRMDFLRSLAEDLELVGHKVQIRETPSSLEFLVDRRDLSQLSKEDLAVIYRQIRLRMLANEKEFISAMEDASVHEFFIDGSELDVDRIHPEITICTTPQQKRIYRYCRYLQSVPTSAGVGRRLWALVHDVGQPSRPLMGIIGLASTMYSVRDRDRYLGWTEIDSRSKHERTRNTGLRRLMQLSVCLALHPYNQLLAGKLMALLALSDPIQSEYQRRYNDPLLGLVTTCATGSHAAIFNRIKPCQLPSQEASRRYATELYRRIGYTSGYTTMLLTDVTVELARHLIENHSVKEVAEGNGSPKSAYGRQRTIAKALSICGIGREVLYLNPKGLYVACLNEQNKRILSDVDSEERPNVQLAADDAIEYWSAKWLTKVRKKPGTLETVAASTRGRMRVSRALDQAAEST